MECETLAHLFDPKFNYKPFEKLQIREHAAAPIFSPGLSFETRCTAELLWRKCDEDGQHALKEFISKHSNGNSRWVWNKYGPLLDSLPENRGITKAELERRFEASFRSQLFR